MQEFQAFLELLGMLATDPRSAVLFILLVVAAVSDYRSLRIPNWLTFGGAAFALLYKTSIAASPLSGFGLAFGGLAFGLAVMLPLYVVRAMGAGDVKLMAMVGAFLGFSATLHAALCVFIVGGIVALGFAFINKSMGRMATNVKDLTQSMMFLMIAGVKPDGRIEPVKSIGKLPYGVCICIGTIISVITRQLGFA